MEEPGRKKSPLLHEKAIQRMAALYHPSMSFMSTVDGIIDELRKRRTNLPPAKLRKNAYMLWLQPNIRPTAEYAVMVSCVSLATPFELLSYFRVLDKYGVEYTVFDDEMCCGYLAPESAVKKEDWEALKRAEEACKDFTRDNVDAARAKGAKNILYFCSWCYYTHTWAQTQGAFGEEGEKIGHLSYFAPIFDRLDKVKLRLEKPTAIGYYEGCHLRAEAVFPGVKIDWTPYRQVLDRIENAEIVDLPNTCCMIAVEKVIEQAKKSKVDVVTSSCLACWMQLRFASRAAGGPPVKFFTTMLDEASGP